MSTIMNHHRLKLPRSILNLIILLRTLFECHVFDLDKELTEKSKVQRNFMGDMAGFLRCFTITPFLRRRAPLCRIITILNRIHLEWTGEMTRLIESPARDGISLLQASSESAQSYAERGSPLHRSTGGETLGPVFMRHLEIFPAEKESLGQESWSGQN